ncbi:MAG TPA: SUF system Fe-S cluster assembly regulator [Steroidobacteraceae bacterium]|nr:SUF system Fe-S cluster assembly regulator [Steroidobacteraceae bacterium]
MLKLGKLADYATTLMTALAADPDKVASAQELAARTHVAPPTVAKLLKLLTKAGLVEATRGAQGGYRLAKAAHAITVMDVIAAIEGPISLTQCATHKGGCAIEPHCGTRSNWRLINQVVRSALASVSLAQMAEPLRRSHPEFPLVPRAAMVR